MSQQHTRAEELFMRAMAENLALAAGGLTDSEKAVRAEKVIGLFTEALSSGLGGERAVACHIHLGVLFWNKIRSSGEEPAGATDLRDCPVHLRTLTELETALWLDAQVGAPVLRNRVQQALALPILDVLWAAIQSRNVSKLQGFDAALAYTYQKVQMLQYLNNIPLPGIYFKMGYYSIHVKQVGTGLEWLKRAVAAEDYAEYEGEEKSATFKMAQFHKNQARKLLEHYAAS